MIGRGVRYFPFAFEGKQPNKRKFDNDMQHELRILEELFYYTHDEQSRYITELKNELRKDGYLPEKDDDKVLATFKLKSEFADNKDFRELLIWANKKSPTQTPKAIMQTACKPIRKRFHSKFTVINCCRKRNLQPMKMMKQPDKSAHKIILLKP